MRVTEKARRGGWVSDCVKGDRIQPSTQGHRTQDAPDACPALPLSEDHMCSAAHLIHSGHAGRILALRLQGSGFQALIGDELERG